MLVIGVDPGSIKMGYGIVDKTGGELTFVAAGVISAPARRPAAERFVELFNGLEDVISEYGPEAAGIEAGYVQPGKPGQLILGAARGIATLALGLRGLTDVREYAPSTVKKVAAGHGHAEKEQVAAMVKLRLGMNKTPDPDAADALAVAITRAVDTEE